MKNSIVFLLIILLITTALLNAENNEWGAIFKEEAERLKESHLMYGPEDYELVLKKWRNPDLLMKKYIELIEISDNSKKNNEERVDIISPYYYDKDNKQNNEAAKLFIYSVNNDPYIDIKIIALDNLGIMALNGNMKARNFIKSNLNTTMYDHKIKTFFHLQNLTIQNDGTSIQYLLQLINQSQNIETTDLKFNSKDEVNIVWYTVKQLLQKRYEINLGYDYVLPLLKQLMFSRTKNVQTVAVRAYYKLTNRTEMRKIYDDCWAKVQDKTTPREEYINALYGLQALYELRDGKHAMKFKGILIYFETLILKTPTKDGLKYIDNGKETRISKEFKIYMQKRLRSK
jgi:hypothetical protein